MITKRMMGLMMSGLGLLGFVAVLAVDLLQAGEHQGIGPTQRAALFVTAAFFLLGLTLIPIGSRPA